MIQNILLVLFGVSIVFTSQCAADSVVETAAGHFENLTLVGQFTTDRAKPKSDSKPERYEIVGITPARDGRVIIQARVQYGQHDVTVPVPVSLHEAGPSTYAISLDDLAIPLLGQGFDARVVFDFDSMRYAGTWKHGDVGGHLWGRLEQTGESPSKQDEQGVPDKTAPVSPTRSETPLN